MSEVREPLRGAVIGAGYFSHFHFDAWNRIDDVAIVACCDVDASKAHAVAAKHGIGSVYTDYRRMLDEHRVDFVDIVTRPDTHLAIGREVADRGIDMICQKPLAPTTDEAHQVVAATSGVRMMVHENFRFQPWYREMKHRLDAGDLGDRLHGITFRNRAGDGHGDDAYMARQPYFQTMQRFLIFEAGIHTVDTFRYLGGEIARVFCTHRRLNPVIAGEDAALAIFEFESGGLGTYDANRFNESTAADPRYTFGQVTLEGNGGTIRLDEDGKMTWQPLGEAPRPIDYGPSRVGFAGDCVAATQRHFVDCLRSGDPFETSGAQYLRSIGVTEAMYRSSQTGCWQPCDWQATE